MSGTEKATNNRQLSQFSLFGVLLVAARPFDFAIHKPPGNVLKDPHIWTRPIELPTDRPTTHMCTIRYRDTPAVVQERETTTSKGIPTDRK